MAMGREKPGGGGGFPPPAEIGLINDGHCELKNNGNQALKLI